MFLKSHPMPGLSQRENPENTEICFWLERDELRWGPDGCRKWHAAWGSAGSLQRPVRWGLDWCGLWTSSHNDSRGNCAFLYIAVQSENSLNSLLMQSVLSLINKCLILPTGDNVFACKPLGHVRRGNAHSRRMLPDCLGAAGHVFPNPWGLLWEGHLPFAGIHEAP